MKTKQGGYTLIELMMVVAIIGVLASIVTPRFDVLIMRAYQSKAKSNLGFIRTTLSIYYSDNAGVWPLAGYPQGDTHYTTDHLSLSTILAPKYTSVIPTPQVHDHMPSFNGLALSFDEESQRLMALSPPKDVFVVWGSPDYTPLLDSPYAYDNVNGTIYISNGNYDSEGSYFYDW